MPTGRILEKERTDDEFMAMYEQYEAFDDLEEAYLDMEEQVTTLVASYVDESPGTFCKNNKVNDAVFFKYLHLLIVN